MKKIEAVIRRTRFEETKEALLENGVEWFSYVDVRGSGHARNRRVYRGVMYETDIIERMMLILIVRDELCDKAIDTIIRTARTGEIGDGRVWVSDIDHYYSTARDAATSRSITSGRPKRWRPGLRRKSKYERRLG